MNEMMNPNMIMGGNVMMARGQDGSVNLFGDMTIINQHTYAPRQQNPMMQMAQIAQLQIANQNRQMELALEHEKLMLEAKKMDMLDRMQLQQQNNLLGNGNPEKVLAIDGTVGDNSIVVKDKEVEDVEYEIHSDIDDVEPRAVSSRNNANPIKPNIFKLNINYDDDIDAVVVEEPEPTGESIDTKNKYINLLDYYNTSGKLNDDIFEKIHSSNCGGEYWVYNKDKPSILFMYSSTFSYGCVDLGVLGIIANHLKSPTIGAEEKDAIREHGLLINVFYEFNKSMLLFIKFVETKDYLRILSSSNNNENVEQYYDNYRICKEVRNWFEDEIDNLRMCNITKFTLMVQPKYDDDADFNKNHEIGVEVNLVMLTYPESIVPIKGFAKTYMEISV